MRWILFESDMLRSISTRRTLFALSSVATAIGICAVIGALVGYRAEWTVTGLLLGVAVFVFVSQR
ncbi:hypothetical protein ACFQJC_01875 [Haloferax namakaokahaiae]|uniref:Uncharacterized protein n=1 Tax=Haloferax namakaokahaiae TaxID=1748331 RepID=A0ABD5ZAV6_9EURY